MSSSAYSSCTSRKDSSSNSNFSVFELINKNKKLFQQQQQQQQQQNNSKTSHSKMKARFNYRAASCQTSDYSSLDLNEPLSTLSLLSRSGTPKQTVIDQQQQQKSFQNLRTKRSVNRAETTDLSSMPGGAGSWVTGSGDSAGRRARLLSLVLQSPRRFSCNSDSADVQPFWVPPEIAQRAKPRSSLPDTNVYETNEMFPNNIHSTVLNFGNYIFFYSNNFTWKLKF